ncbi:MAG TPA: alpha/beta hydrolase family protein [Chitinophagaceae bacterium]|jgi:S-formylglutathione hydrolase FrmB|nr:alpha/beta hydrolase family protein [Chitinophagaceae bacterium]
MKKRLPLFIALFFMQLVKAATVDTVSIYSDAMKKEFKCVVIQPLQDKQEPRLFPVVYLLHGYGGWYSNWLIRVPQLKDYAEQYKLIIVCPDGGNSSWYFDSPVDPSMKYETYIGTEVPDYIEMHYPTISDRRARAITGLSMGGHGGLFLGLRHAERFGACGSMSGGVDLNYSRNKYDVSKRIGDTINHADNWNIYSVINMVEHYPKDTLAMIIDCGTGDIFYKDNHALHEKMIRLKIPHEYIERPGKHDWAYWSSAVQYQLLFFSNYFYPRK